MRNVGDYAFSIGHNNLASLLLFIRAAQAVSSYKQPVR
jgi:hypothetical protein